MKEAVVLFPGVGMGHLIPAIELAKLFTHHDFSVTILLIEPPFAALSSAADPFISRVSSAHPSISFHHLPKITPPSPPNSHPMTLIFELLRLANPHISDFLESFSQTSNIRALVLDMFCTAALDVANDFNLPAYFFFASCASSLAAFLFFPTLQSQMINEANIKDLGDELPLRFPGLHPIPASHWLDSLKDRDDEVCKEFIFHFERLPRANGIMVNTFELLEPRAIKALVNGLCVPGRTMPPIHCIGPLNGDRSEGEEGEKHECLTWLDAQPKGSVVFLCFGSMGSFSPEQLKEIATGLERSGQRFLWVVRSPTTDGTATVVLGPRLEPDLNVLMPQGFLEMTEGRGMVVKSWAPQAKVLGHESVGGFVSHCGWNSILEAVSAGVPMIAWPLYAEQRMNMVFLVEEAKLAVEMKGYKEGLVSAEEVETKVRWLMESEGGKEMKDRAMTMKGGAMAARKKGGSSDAAWIDLVNALSVRC